METNKKPENPQAYPMDYGHEGYRMEAGMTLRDYFANSADVKDLVDGLKVDKAIELMNVKAIPSKFMENTIFWFEVESKLKYMKADAMLKQRELNNE